MSALPVNIVPNPPLPDSGVYPVGSSIDLTCQVQGGYPPLMYTWNSTCTGGFCFVVGETTGMIRQSALHSIDSGSHTCSVTDYTGQTGNSTVQFNLTGIGMIIFTYMIYCASLKRCCTLSGRNWTHSKQKHPTSTQLWQFQSAPMHICLTVCQCGPNSGTKWKLHH